MKNFIHSRKHPAANLVNGYSKVTLIRRAHASARNGVLEDKFARDGEKLAVTSFLRSANAKLLTKQRAGVAGANILDCVLSRRRGTLLGSYPAELVEFLGADVDLDDKVYQMQSGISYNAVKFKVGMHIEFQTPVDVKIMNVGLVTLMYYIERTDADPIVVLRVEHCVLATPYKRISIIKTFGERQQIFVNLGNVTYMLHCVPHWTSSVLECVLRVRPVMIK